MTQTSNKPLSLVGILRVYRSAPKLTPELDSFALQSIYDAMLGVIGESQINVPFTATKEARNQLRFEQKLKLKLFVFGGNDE